MDKPANSIDSDLVPVIDLSRFDNPTDRRAISQEIRSACLSTGFFLVKGHGIPTEVCSAITAASKRYFALPERERMNDLIDEHFRRGFMPRSEGSRATVESYELSLDLPLDDPDVVAGYFLHGPNRWPKNHPWLRAAVEPYLEAALGLGEKLQRLFALSLDLEEDFFVELCKRPTLHMRLFHYFSQTEEERRKHFATGAHTDLGMLTILMQDPNGGLELQVRDGEWIQAPYVENAFVINVGDLLELWTNELYVSTPHRVVGLTDRDRYSVPVFFSPAFKTVVECLPSCLAPGEVPKFAPLNTGEYLEARLRSEGTPGHNAYVPIGGHRGRAA